MQAVIFLVKLHGGLSLQLNFYSNSTHQYLPATYIIGNPTLHYTQYLCLHITGGLLTEVKFRSKM